MNVKLKMYYKSMKKFWNAMSSSGRWRKMILIMNLKLFILLCCVHVANANVFSQEQRLDVAFENEKMLDVIDYLQRQTGFQFFYLKQNLAVASNVTLSMKQATLAEILDNVLKDHGFSYEIQDGIVIIKVADDDKEKKKSLTVKGFVYDEKKQPMPGVTVQVVGTSVGTATTEKGWFSIALPLLKGKLKFSFVGYESQEVEFTEMTDTLKVYMKEEISDLNEVVVRAYGSQKKRETISAISTVTAEELKEVPAASIATLLQGRLAGVNVIQQSGAPGSASVIAVRGFNSLLVDGASDGQPLWVIDGVPMHSFVSPVTGTNTLADLDPNMIESVTVLKDAAAASIYGSRAGNGVILVTTKKGKVGEAQFSANVSYTISQLMEYPTQTGGRMERWLELLYQRGKRSASYDWVSGLYIFSSSYEDAYKNSGFYDEFWGNGQVSSAKLDFSLQDSLDPYYNNSTNWWKYAFRRGKVLNANVQASGGSDRFRYMVGLGYYNEKGIMINSGYKRVNLITNLSANFTSKLRMDTRVYLTYVDRSMNKSGYMTRYEGISVNPSTQCTIFPATKELEEEWMKQVAGIKDRTDDYRAMVSAFLEYELIKGLTFSASANIDFSQANMNKFTPGTLDKNYHESKSEGAINRIIMLSSEELLHYNKTFNEEHNIDLLLGFNVNKEQEFYIGGHGLRGTSDDVYYYDPERQTTEVINRGSEDYPNYVSTRYYKSDFTEKRMVSYFGRLGYNYKQRYLIEFTYRKDGSSTFGEGHRWANFPSVALGWTFSEEPFIKTWTGKWLNWGKIRGSYGTSGQVFTEAYLAHGLMTIFPYVFMNNNMVTSDRPVAPDLTWEKTEQYDIGLDMDMFNYRLNLKLDYYYKYTSSLLFNVPLPGGRLYPFFERMENAMAVSNEGLELELQADVLRDGPVSWRMKFNVARNWNRFEKSYSGKDFINNSRTVMYIIGRPLYGLYVYAHEGYYNSEDEVPRYYTLNGECVFLGKVSTKSGVSGQVGNYKLVDFNGDGEDDVYFAGSTLPLAHGGWVNEVKWKNFDLNLLFNYVLGRKIINANRANSFDFWRYKAKMFDYRDLKVWTAPEDKPNMPTWGKVVVAELDSNIEKVNYVTLKQLSLGYNLSERLAGKAGFAGVRFFVTAENLFYLTNYSGENPEVVDVYRGIDRSEGYPLPRKWTLGLTLNF